MQRLHQRAPEQLSTHVDELFPALLSLLGDNSEEVAKVGLGEPVANEDATLTLPGVCASLAALHATYFDKLMSRLVAMLEADRGLLETRSSLIVRELSVRLG